MRQLILFLQRGKIKEAYCKPTENLVYYMRSDEYRQNKLMNYGNTGESS